jgi:hypothetical protein
MRSWLLILAPVLLVACDQAAPETCRHACTTPNPEPTECAIQLTLSDDCAGLVEKAEVAIAIGGAAGSPGAGDNCLEPYVLRPGDTLVSCARIPVDGAFKWTVRAVDWQWGPWEDTCPKGGLSLPYALSCR